MVLLTLLSHLTSALEVPLDREQSLLDSAKLKCGSERFIFSRNLTFSYRNGTRAFLLTNANTFPHYSIALVRPLTVDKKLKYWKDVSCRDSVICSFPSEISVLSLDLCVVAELSVHAFVVPNVVPI